MSDLWQLLIVVGFVVYAPGVAVTLLVFATVGLYTNRHGGSLSLFDVSASIIWPVTWSIVIVAVATSIVFQKLAAYYKRRKTKNANDHSTRK
mgnify:FL=1